MPARRTDAGQRFGVLAVLAATTCWGLGGVLGKSVGASGLVVSFYRLWMGAVLLNLVLVVMKRRLTWDVLKWSWLGGVLLRSERRARTSPRSA